MGECEQGCKLSRGKGILSVEFIDDTFLHECVPFFCKCSINQGMASNSLGLKTYYSDAKIRGPLPAPTIILSSGTGPTLDPKTCFYVNAAACVIAIVTALYNVAYVIYISSL